MAHLFGPRRDRDSDRPADMPHSSKVFSVVMTLLDDTESHYAWESIGWALYPELTPEETASAALDGFEVTA
jgi:hypothetical protein